MMDSKDNDNKGKYAADDAEEEAPPKKQKMIDDDNDNGNDDNDDDNSSSTNDYSLELEEEMNLPSGSEEELLI
jgi:hypothetical protein